MPVSEGESDDFFSRETVFTAQGSVEYVLRKDHTNVELMAATLHVPPLLVFGPFEQLLEKAVNAASAKSALPLPPHQMGNNFDLNQVRPAVAAPRFFKSFTLFLRIYGLEYNESTHAVAN